MGITKRTASLPAIVAILLTSLIICSTPAMAWWRRPPSKQEAAFEEMEVVEEQEATREGETGSKEETVNGETASTEEPATNIGKVEALVWDDSINPDGTYSIEELVDGILVDVYLKEADGTWTLISRKATEPGSLTPAICNEHGWVA
ncbi:MAG: hypothetical protein SWK76_12685 [Actinomycetota bacterium]|nr:hypothetical protein [Actinomycetota bacterium]